MSAVHQTVMEILRVIHPSNVPVRHKTELNALRQEVAQFLQQRFPLHHERVGEPQTMGSQDKGTDICLGYDLDVYVPFKFGFKLHPKGMKAAVFAALQERFPFPPMRVVNQGVCVKVEKVAGNALVSLDVVPGMEKSLNGFKDASTNEEHKYLVLYDTVCDAERTTNLHRQVRLVKENMLHYRDIVRLLKGWRHKENFRIGSYALELLVYQAATAKGAPKTGAPAILLGHVLRHAIPFLDGDGTLYDIGANYPWKDFLKEGAKIQLAGRWRKLLTALDNSDAGKLRSFFP